MSLSAFDLFFLVKELQFLVGAKVDKVYHQEDDLILVLHKGGKHLLKITPSALFLTSQKFEPRSPTPLCMFLRKRLSQAKLTTVEQLGFERIVEIVFTKQETFHLIIELFSHGNVLLCDKDRTILAALHTQQWRHRTLKAGESYQPPPLQKSPLALKAADLTSFSKSLVKTLATEYSLGGKYAEEVCLHAKVPKEAVKLSDGEMKRLLRAIKALAAKTPQPGLQGADAVPFKLHSLDAPFVPYVTLSAAIEHLPAAPKPDTARLKAETILRKQKEKLAELEQEAGDSRAKGDLIYKNYAYVQEILDAIKAAREKDFSWDEIAKRLKTRGVHLKNKKVEVELD